MKTTIKLTLTTAFAVQPCKAGGVVIEYQDNFGEAFGGNCEALAWHLTPDQAGALIFALEQATEAAQIAQERAAA